MLLVLSEVFVAPVKELASGTSVSYLLNSVDESFMRTVTVSSSEREATEYSGRLYYAQHFSRDMLVDLQVDLLQSLRNQRQRESK